MIERWKRESDFYLIFTGLLTLSIIVFAEMTLNSLTSLMIMLTTIICLMMCFTISESILTTYIHRPWLRKLLLAFALFLTPTAPYIFHGLEQIIVITLLSGWLFSTREFFYLNKGNLYLCGLCAFSIFFMAPALIPFLIFQCYFFFKKDRENSYLLFTFFALPGLLYLVHYWEKTESIISPNFRELHPQLFSENLIHTIFAFQDQLLSMTQQPILLIGFIVSLVCILIQQNQSRVDENLWMFDLSLSLLYCYPLISLIYGSQTMDNHNYLNFLLSFPVILILFPKFTEFFRGKTSSSNIKFGLLLLIFIGIYPFYVNAITNNKATIQVNTQPVN